MSVKIIYFENLKKLKKLAGTKWGASSKILKQVYVRNVRPVLEFASTAWAVGKNQHQAIGESPKHRDAVHHREPEHYPIQNTHISNQTAFPCK